MSETQKPPTFLEAFNQLSPALQSELKTLARVLNLPACRYTELQKLYLLLVEIADINRHLVERDRESIEAHQNVVVLESDVNIFWQISSYINTMKDDSFYRFLDEHKKNTSHQV